MRKTIIILAIVLPVLCFAIFRFDGNPPAPHDETTTLAQSPVASDPKRNREGNPESDRETGGFETTYRKLPGVASFGDTDAPATATFLGKRFIQSESYISNDPNDPAQLSEHALVLENESATEQEVVVAVQGLLENLKQMGNAGYFDTGPNVEMTNALLGYNNRKIAFLPANSSRINVDGELIDHWGTPYFFHLISSKNVTVQSAGQDRTLFTGDDLVSPTHVSDEYDHTEQGE